MNGHISDILARRSQHVGPNLSVLYRQDPIHVVRGSGQFLFDADGTQYLDCMNNVPHVGHSHPRVAEAAAAQLRSVNTNTRFLYAELVDYADRLCALVPDRLEVCYFVNSGSEANELAIRMSQAHTGRRGVVTLSGAYHGTTSSLIDISPYKFDRSGGLGRRAHVQISPAPDPYRGPHRGANAGDQYVAEVESALVRGAENGFPASMFISEPMLGTCGQIVPPRGYLPNAYATAREHGAVVVADEIQVGFGRVGEAFWASSALGGTPDILTLGKPIGNGFPLGAIITTRQIADSFDNGMEYFNTFGGTPLACAVGLAVLDILRDEELPSHAASVGKHLMDGFEVLAGRHHEIGDVRGMGLFIGVEFVLDPVTREPDTALARWVVSELRQQHILISTDGVNDNVLKIKPPLTFDNDDADRVLEAVDALLAGRRS